MTPIDRKYKNITLNSLKITLLFLSKLYSLIFKCSLRGKEATWTTKTTGINPMVTFLTNRITKH